MKKDEGVTVKIVRGGYEVSIPGHAPRVYKPARGPLTEKGALECAKFAYRQACAQAKATKLAGPPVSATKARKILHDKKIRGVPLTKAQRGMFGAASRGNPRLKKYGLVTLLKMKYKDVEQLRRWGHISDAEWKSYVRVWREASPRFSDLGTGHGEPTARERAHIKKFQADYDRRFPKGNPSGDRAVILAFLDKKPASSKKLSSTGRRLDGNWMGGSGIAEWSQGGIVFRDLGSRAAQQVQRAISKEAPKNWIKGWANPIKSVRPKPVVGAFKAFHGKTGGIVGQAAKTAHDLAMGEHEAERRGWGVTVEGDWESTQEEGAPRFIFAVRDRQGRILASLGGVDVDDVRRGYGRQVAAELAFEALVSRRPGSHRGIAGRKMNPRMWGVDGFFDAPFPRASYYVTATDSFFSRSPAMPNETNVVVCPCDSYEEAEIVAQNLRDRGEMKRINIASSLKSRRGVAYSVLDKKSAPLYYKSGRPFRKANPRSVASGACPGCGFTLPRGVTRHLNPGTRRECGGSPIYSRDMNPSEPKNVCMKCHAPMRGMGYYCKKCSADFKRGTQENPLTPSETGEVSERYYGSLRLASEKAGVGRKSDAAFMAGRALGFAEVDRDFGAPLDQHGQATTAIPTGRVAATVARSVGVGEGMPGVRDFPAPPGECKRCRGSQVVRLGKNLVKCPLCQRKAK